MKTPKIMKLQVLGVLAITSYEIVDVNKQLTIERARVDDMCGKMAKLENSGIEVARNTGKRTVHHIKVRIKKELLFRI